MAQKKILVIDDMPNAAAMIKARLEASGYQVMAASDGRQGLDLCFRGETGPDPTRYRHASRRRIFRLYETEEIAQNPVCSGHFSYRQR